MTDTEAISQLYEFALDGFDPVIQWQPMFRKWECRLYNAGPNSVQAMGETIADAVTAIMKQLDR